MSGGGIRIAKMSLRLRGVTPREAEQRVHSIAREIAHSLVRERAALPPGESEIGQLSVRVKTGGGGSGIAEQVRRQLGGGRPRE